MARSELLNNSNQQSHRYGLNKHSDKMKENKQIPDQKLNFLSEQVCRKNPERLRITLLLFSGDSVFIHYLSWDEFDGYCCINSKIQMAKRRVRGYRNTDNFINMIYFLCLKLKFSYPLNMA